MKVLFLPEVEKYLFELVEIFDAKTILSAFY